MKRFNVILNKMPGYIISVRNNKILVSTTDNPQDVAEKAVDKDVVNGSEILDDELFAAQLGELLLEEFGPKPNKLPLNFLVEPSDVILSFLITDKTSNNGEEFLLALAEKKLASKGLVLEDVYFSYQKLAPFVHQFIAISKPKLESYLAVASDLDLELKSVAPWTLLLPKTLQNMSESKTFVVEGAGTGLAVHTEFGGVNEIEQIEKEDFEKLIDEEKIVWDGNKHELFVNQFNENLRSSQINLLSLLPLPVEKESQALVYVGSAVATLIILGGVYFGLSYANKVEESDVLGGNNQEEIQVEPVIEEEVVVEENQTEEETEEVTEEFARREYLRVKVLNSTQTFGLAGDVTEYLNGLGYDTADPSDYDEELETTQVRLNPDFENYEDVLAEDLSERFGEVEVTFDLEEDLDYNALVIVGTDGE